MIEKQTNNTTKIKNIKYKNKSIIESFNLLVDNNESSNESSSNDIEKSSLVDEYLSITNNNHIKKIEFDNRELCRSCRNVLTCLQHEAIMICSLCGYQEPLLVERKTITASKVYMNGENSLLHFDLDYFTFEQQRQSLS